MVRYFIGTSGWHYDDWRGRFYPETLAKNLESVYIYFNNDIAGYALDNAKTISGYVDKSKIVD